MDDKDIKEAIKANEELFKKKGLENVPRGFYGAIIRTEEVERAGVKGLLVWDAILFNEITFQERVTLKKTSLYKCWSDNEARHVFERLVDEYKRGNSNEKVIIHKEKVEESPADELVKYKHLLDDGTITLEEFNKKKKELLG